jgi:hypothetical protein
MTDINKEIKKVGANKETCMLHVKNQPMTNLKHSWKYFACINSEIGEIKETETCVRY